MNGIVVKLKRAERDAQGSAELPLFHGERGGLW
jgi:hypothetical protein